MLVLPDPEVASLGRAGRAEVLNISRCRTDDGDGGVLDGEVFVLLQCVVKRVQAVVDQLR